MKTKILLVEDDADILAVGSAVITRGNYHVSCAASYAEALVQITTQKFGLVVTDFRLGDGLGSDLVTEIRKEQPDTPVIVITGSVQDLPKWLLSGPLAVRVIPKPFSFPSLLEAIRKELGSMPAFPLEEKQDTPWPMPLPLPMSIEAMVHQVVNQESILAVTDRKGGIIYANDRFCDISGYSRAELLGQNHRLLKSGQHPPLFYKQIWATILSGETWRGEICNKAKDGHLYYVDTVIAPLRYEGVVTHFLSIRTDVTERKHAQLALTEQSKREQEERHLVELGNMTEGVLQDLNDILARVMELAGEQSGQHGVQLKESVGRMTQLMRKLRNSAMRQPPKSAWFRLPPVLWCACSLARYRAGTPGNLTISHFPEVPVDCEIWGDEGRIFEVILNLLTNAVEAVAGEKDPEICIQTKIEGRLYTLTIEDNGPGVLRSIMPSLFDLYASTKGRGRGLGLAISRQIVSAHNGRLCLENPGGNGAGARFQLQLPARPVPAERQSVDVPPPGNKRFVLVAEDDSDVLRLIEHTVRDIGLTVMLTSNGTDIPALLGHVGQTLAAAVIDTCSPDQETGALALVRRAAPELPVVLISEAMRARGKMHTPWGVVEALPKPFETLDFAEALYAALAGASDHGK